ncbi:CheR family methyltransferase [Pedobacter metabolipauper]|uniref:protein-glutamate O-methyltransferase n=1 Tax=Pedobacter metabolipauper TaxID=425513 RepID=A0A4R6T0D4_9SPHI|nr:CheR family methyltransferase [Pedobacter metabolipauper]TDQ11815.1 two-component system CheB/CheR fusion protein [Pedobacter metabolipauper]
MAKKARGKQETIHTNEEDLSQLMVQREGKSNQANFFPIIAMGGSAGSFGAFEKFFLHMPANSGFAFVIIMHLDPTHNMDVSGLLQSSTSMPIIEAKDGMVIAPDHVYVIPPNRDMGIHNGKLLLFNASRAKGAHMSIDYFLQSLAEDQWNYAVGIIFSGMGADGETGVRMVKEKLGLAIVQSPETAEYSSMPLTSIKTGMVDYVLAPEEMPAKLMQYLNHPAIREAETEEMVLERNNSTHLQKILMLLRSQTGHDFTLYKKNTINRRVERRIAFHQLPDYVHYVNYLRENPHEIDILFNELLIGVTKFFRDREAFDLLKDQLYSKLIKKGIDEPIRIWIAGCSTGEEAYSIAIIISEYLATLAMKQVPKVQIFATDLDPNAIEHARVGFYFANIVSEVSLERLDKFFLKRNNGYIVKKEIREMIVFAQHNLIKDAPFTRLDLLCCRNVMIYLTADLQKKLLPVFHYSLVNQGFLFLGPAESVGVYNEAFTVIDSKWKIYRRKEGIAGVGKMIDFPFNITNPFNKTVKEIPVKQLAKSYLTEYFHKILLENYTPASLLINEKGEILYINGKMDRYLQLHSGEAVMNVHKMAREELKYAIGNAIYQAAIQKRTIEFNDLKINENGKISLIDFSVEYLNDIQLQGLFILSFKDKGLMKKRAGSAGKIKSTQVGAVDELEKELSYTKQQLNTTIEQMETSLEELKSTNEELQSTNEELQSTNEEALTTKEEMQSLNEELMTINLQYQNKAEELTRLNNDMKNLLDNTEIGTIFLDNELNILRFTPQVTRLFNVIPSDIGRSITHIVSNFDYPSIENAILEVIENLNGKELEIKTRKHDWYNLRIMPYRTLDNFINGAVLTFTKITPVKALENKLSTMMVYTQNHVNSLADAAVLLDYDRKVLVVNELFLKMFNFREFEIKEQFFMEVVHNKWNTTKLDALLHVNSELTELYLQHEFPGMGIKKMIVYVQCISENKLNKDTVMIITFKFQEREQEKEQ